MDNFKDQKPTDFFSLRVHEINIDHGVTGLCIGYENKSWRYDQFVDHVMEWIPEFALNWSERKRMRDFNCVHLMKKAARKIYETNKFDNRGEFGELFLHIAIRQSFNTIPAVSKIYYKDAHNDTVKGFDAVHIVLYDDELQLWIGESKFYNHFSKAVHDVVDELVKHTNFDYLRSEFNIIVDKIDKEWPEYDRLTELIHPNTSMDNIVDKVCIPVLLTYDSKIINEFDSISTSFNKSFCEEIQKNYGYFVDQTSFLNLSIHLFLFPLHKKVELIKKLDEKLKLWQNL